MNAKEARKIMKRALPHGETEELEIIHAGIKAKCYAKIPCYQWITFEPNETVQSILSTLKTEGYKIEKIYKHWHQISW